MKKGILVLLVFAVVTGSAFAFDILSFPAPVQPGAVMIDAGIGLRHLTYVGHKISIPPLFAQGEFALPVGVPISVGAGLSFAQWKWDYWGLWGLGDYGYKITYITPHTRANWHWGFDIPWLDFYTGLSLGWNIASYKWHGDYYGYSASAKSGFYWAFQAGAHFYFTQNIGAMVETGYPYWIKAGIAFKFGGKPSPKQASRGSSSSGEYMLVNADALNVRSGPSADHAAVGVVERNARVQVLEKGGQWWKIKFGNIEGYVNSSYLRPLEG